MNIKNRFFLEELRKIKEKTREYSEKVKENAIKKYIYDTQGEFDYADLATKMGMTFRQLKYYLVYLKEKGEIFIKNGIYTLRAEDYNLFSNQIICSNQKNCDIMIDAEEYIPKNFKKKFNGYS